MSTVPELKREYLEMVPEFHGEPAILPRYLEVCEKLVARFYDLNDPNNFQNEYLIASLLAKIKGKAAEVVHNSKVSTWLELKSTLINGYSDRRDCYTLNLEIAEQWQSDNESPFDFYHKIQNLLHLQIAYYKNHFEAHEAVVLINFSRKTALRVLLRGLKDPIGHQMRTKNPPDLDTALNMLTNDFQIKMKPGMNKSFQKTNNYSQNDAKIIANDSNKLSYQNKYKQYQKGNDSNHQSCQNAQLRGDTPMSISTNSSKPFKKSFNKPQNAHHSYNIETDSHLYKCCTHNSCEQNAANDTDNFLEQNASGQLK